MHERSPCRKIHIFPALTLILALAVFFCCWTSGAVSAGEAAARNKGERPMREIEAEGFRIQLDLSTQVLRLDIPEDRGFGDVSGRLEVKREEAAVVPTLSGMGREDFISASILAQKARQFDDGLYAAVDLAAQQGAGCFAGKASLLKKVARALAALPETPAGQTEGVIFAACKLGRVEADVPARLQKFVDSTVAGFLKDPLRSKPIGFYTWTEELAAIFRQDRMLQTELKDRKGTEALTRILQADRDVRDVYEGYLSLVARLTNPLIYPDLRGQIAALERGKLDVPSKEIYFFPPSRSHETELIKRLYGNRPIPEGFNLVEEMTKRIQAGTLQLKPTADSGWYDYQTWSLEPLAIPDEMPEAPRLDLSPSYRKQLLELFKGLLALTRETHIKQLEIPMAGMAAPGPRPRPVVRVYPELDAEPLATMYLRRAQSYQFIREVIEKAFGPEALTKMHRQSASGPVRENLGDELRRMEALFYGAHVTVCRQIGAPHSDGLGTGPAKDEAAVSTWAAFRDELKDDPDLGRDARMMVPVFYDIARKKTKVWVFLGWAARPLIIAFAKAPAAAVFDQAGRQVAADRVDLQFRSTSRTVAYPVTAEVYVEKILDRDEFRRHCDRYKTPSAILASLK